MRVECDQSVFRRTLIPNLNFLVLIPNFNFLVNCSIMLVINSTRIIRARRALYIPRKNKGGYGGKLITVKIPQMKRLRTKVHNYLLPIYQSTIFAKLK